LDWVLFHWPPEALPVSAGWLRKTLGCRAWIWTNCQEEHPGDTARLLHGCPRALTWSSIDLSDVSQLQTGSHSCHPWKSSEMHTVEVTTCVLTLEDKTEAQRRKNQVSTSRCGRAVLQTEHTLESHTQGLPVTDAGLQALPSTGGREAGVSGSSLFHVILSLPPSTSPTPNIPFSHFA
jgi:hypothetical protein